MITSMDTLHRPNGLPLKASVRTEGGSVRGRQDLAAAGQSMPGTKQATATPASNIGQAVGRLNDYVQILSRDLEFSFDEQSGDTIVKVIDSESGEVIRQIPPEEILAISQALNDALADTSGVILHAQA